jgi:hypothetical protein
VAPGLGYRLHRLAAMGRAPVRRALVRLRYQAGARASLGAANEKPAIAAGLGTVADGSR